MARRRRGCVYRCAERHAGSRVERSSRASRFAMPRSRIITTITPAACAAWPPLARRSSPRKDTSRRCEMIVETPHTNPPDALENARKAGKAVRPKFSKEEGAERRKQTRESIRSPAIRTSSRSVRLRPERAGAVPEPFLVPRPRSPGGPRSRASVANDSAQIAADRHHVGGHGGVGFTRNFGQSCCRCQTAGGPRPLASLR